MKSHFNYNGISDGPPLPTSFESACQHPKWSEAIDREYNALIRRNTWKHIKRTADMNTEPFKLTFRGKKLDGNGTSFLYKAICVLHDDKQHEYIDYEPDQLYAPVATH